MREVLLAVAAGLAAVVTAAWWALLYRDARHTYRRFLRPNAVQAGFRAYRSLWVRSGLWWLAWPHLLDRLIGTHGVQVARTPARVVGRVPGAILLRYGDRPPTGRPPVLVVHAFVTRPWILDLLPGRSLVEALLAEGHDVYLLDWGEDPREAASQGIGAKVDQVAGAARHVLAVSGAERLHVLGYCTGGTAALAAAAAYPEMPLASLVLVAPIVDTAVPGGMRPVVTQRLLAPVWLLDGDGCVPGAAVREAFHLLRPELIRARIARLRLGRDPVFRETYSALVRWAWEQRRLPGRLFFDLVDLYRHNTLYEGRLSVGGVPVDLSRVRVPALVTVADRDHIVPIASSLAVTRLPGMRTEVLRCPSGHASMLMGREARDLLYPTVAAWLRRHEEPAADQLAHRGQRG